MFKKLVFILSLSLNINCFADVVSSTHVDDVSHVRAGVTDTIYTGHDYIIDNKSGIAQTVQVCFDVTSCPEYSWQIKNIHQCINETVANGQTISRHKVMQFQVNYNFTGYCNLIAKTTMTGWTHHTSVAQGKVYVSYN